MPKNKFIIDEKDKKQYLRNFLYQSLTKEKLANEKYNTFLPIFASFKTNFDINAYTSFRPIDNISIKKFNILELYCDHILEHYLNCDISIIDVTESTRKTNELKYDILTNEISDKLLLEILRNQKEDLMRIMLDYKNIKYE